MEPNYIRMILTANTGSMDIFFRYRFIVAFKAQNFPFLTHPIEHLVLASMSLLLYNDL